MLYGLCRIGLFIGRFVFFRGRVLILFCVWFRVWYRNVCWMNKYIKYILKKDIINLNLID